MLPVIVVGRLLRVLIPVTIIMFGGIISTSI